MIDIPRRQTRYRPVHPLLERAAALPPVLQLDDVPPAVLDLLIIDKRELTPPPVVILVLELVADPGDELFVNGVV